MLCAPKARELQDFSEGEDKADKWGMLPSSHKKIINQLTGMATAVVMAMATRRATAMVTVQ